MVAIPGQLFYSTQIPACLWFLVRDRSNHKFRDRRGEVLFIDARRMGFMVDRTHRDLSDEHISRITGMYRLWRGETGVPPEAVEGLTAYEDIPGFCKAAPLEEIRRHGHVLTPGRYVGAKAAEADDEPFADKMARLVADLREQRGAAARLDHVNQPRAQQIILFQSARAMLHGKTKIAEFHRKSYRPCRPWRENHNVSS